MYGSNFQSTQIMIFQINGIEKYGRYETGRIILLIMIILFRVCSYTLQWSILIMKLCYPYGYEDNDDKQVCQTIICNNMLHFTT